METVRFYTGYTGSSGASPFELPIKKISTKILAELREIKIELLTGMRGYDKVYELIVTCEKGSPEETWFQNDPLFEAIKDG